MMMMMMKQIQYRAVAMVGQQVTVILFLKLFNKFIFLFAISLRLNYAAKCFVTYFVFLLGINRYSNRE